MLSVALKKSPHQAFVPVHGFVRSFLSSEAVKDVKVTAFDVDENKKINPLPFAICYTDSEGNYDFESQVGKEIFIKLEHKDYHATVSGCVKVPPEGIFDSKNPFNHLASQLPSLFFGTKVFGFAMNTPLTREGKVQAVALTATDAGTTLRDFPHGLDGVRAELFFDDPQLQEKWLHVQGQRVINKFNNETINIAGNAVSILTALFLYSQMQKVWQSILAGVTAKTISAVIAWKYFVSVVVPFYWDVWKRWPLKDYTNPLNHDLEQTSRDGGILFNLKDLNLPSSGARFTIRATKPGVKFNEITGYAFPDTLTIYSPPYTLAVVPTPNAKPKTQDLSIPEQKGRPVRLVKSLGVGFLMSLMSYYLTRNTLKAGGCGGLSAVSTMLLLEFLYKKTAEKNSLLQYSIFNKRSAPNEAALDHSKRSLYNLSRSPT